MIPSPEGKYATPFHKLQTRLLHHPHRNPCAAILEFAETKSLPSDLPLRITQEINLTGRDLLWVVLPCSIARDCMRVDLGLLTGA